jgi:uncharacterized protein
MDIKHESDGSRGAFFVEEEGQRLAEMTYVLSGTAHLVIEHTGVSAALKGRGVGKQLVAAGVEYARSHGLVILPLCSFAKAEFDKSPAYADVLYRQP